MRSGPLTCRSLSPRGACPDRRGGLRDSRTSPGYSARLPPGPSPHHASHQLALQLSSLTQASPVASRPALQPRVGLLPAGDQRPPLPTSDLPGRDRPTPSTAAPGELPGGAGRRFPSPSPSQRAPLRRALLFAAAGPTRHTPPCMPARCRGRLHPDPAATRLPLTGPRRSPHPPSH